MSAIHGLRNATAEPSGPDDPAVRTEALGRMAAGIAHDLNGMLAGIGATAELLARRATPRDRAALDAIAEQAGRAGALMRQLMEFARAEQLQPRTLALPLLVESLVPALRARAGGTAELRVRAEECRAHADPIGVERVLINIVGNALDAIQESGVGNCVEIATGFADVQVPPAGAPFVTPGRYALLCVADNGPGVPPALAHRIFEPYFSTRPDGTGLGLASAFGLVKQQGGYLLHDRGPLGGARFRVFLPAA